MTKDSAHCLSLYVLHPPHLPGRQADFDAARVDGCARQDLLDDPLRHLPGALMVFLDDDHDQTRMDVLADRAVRL